MNYYDQIKELFISNEIYKKVKDYSKNKNDLETYYNVGKLIIEAQGGEKRAKYGNNLIKEYSVKLTKELGKNYSTRLLYKTVKYYNFVTKNNLPTVSAISWSHFDEILKLKDINKIKYYINICEKNNLTIRQLRERIKNKEYERLPESTKNNIEFNSNNDIKDFIKNPIIIKNSSNIDNISEKALHKLILEDITSFMKELGNGFSFIDSEYKIKIGDIYNYIDLLLFNYIYNSFVVIELKVTEFKAEYIGQIKKYMNYIDKNIKQVNQDKTIGIIICKKENKFIMEYCSDERILLREYLLI